MANMANQYQAPPHPDLNLPTGNVCCEVSIINTTTDIVCATSALLEPSIPGHEMLNLPTYAFHIKHQGTGVEVMFDLGSRSDWWNLTPVIQNAISSTTPGLRVTKGVDEILRDGGIDLKNIQALILSHWHWDHIGDPSKFPPHASLVVGPQFKEKIMPGYPRDKNGSMLETDFECREVREIDFSNSSMVGHFRAHDFLGDGSLLLLDTPGHAIGHMCALVRDTPTTFILLGGDVTHFGGAFRPSAYIPFPELLPSSTILDATLPNPCPCLNFISLHPLLRQEPSMMEPGKLAETRITPFYSPSIQEGSWYVDAAAAQRSINILGEFDASPDILVVLAHDPEYAKYFEFFPLGKMNGWKMRECKGGGKGWKEGSHWAWVNELPRNGQPAREPLVRGRWKAGQLIG